MHNKKTLRTYRHTKTDTVRLTWKNTPSEYDTTNTNTLSFRIGQHGARFVENMVEELKRRIYAHL